MHTKNGSIPILIILIVEVFKDAYDIKAHSTLDLLQIAAAIHAET
jgi:hypothetical protein